MKIELKTWTEFWPKCLKGNGVYCGDRSPDDTRAWHVADMCDIPSCPLRCAIRDALTDYKRKI